MQAHQKEGWLAEILQEAYAAVQKWPAWARSDDVRREFPKLYPKEVMDGPGQEEH